MYIGVEVSLLCANQKLHSLKIYGREILKNLFRIIHLLFERKHIYYKTLYGPEIRHIFVYYDFLIVQIVLSM